MLDLQKMSNLELEALATTLKAGTTIRPKKRISQNPIQPGHSFATRGGWYRKILDCSTRYVIFLEQYSWREGMEEPQIPRAMIDILLCWRAKGGLHYVMDQDLDDDWVIASVTDRSFSHWLGRATQVQPAEPAKH